MSDIPTIELPAELLPADGRFGSGPSKVRTEALLELGISGAALMGTSHRNEGARATMRQIREGLSRLFALPDGYEVLLGNGGTSAFWDAAAFGLIEHRSQHLVFGAFSERFASAVATAPHLQQPQLIEASPGSAPIAEAAEDIDAYCLTQNETSTGVMMDVVRPAGARGLVLVDATSAAGAMLVDPHEFDVYYFAPQKAFGADGGTWIALCSPAALARIEGIAASGRPIPPFLSLRNALDNSRLEQTYNTPALATLFLLQRQIEWFHGMGGLAWASKRSTTSSAAIYHWAQSAHYAFPFVVDERLRSTTVATVEFDSMVNANTVSAVLRSNGVVDTEGYRKLGRNMIRIGTFPNIDLTDVEKLTQAIDFIVARL